MKADFGRTLSVVRGDLFSASVRFRNLGANATAQIKAVWFSSHRLGVKTELFQAGDEWFLRIPGTVTKSFPLDAASFDITMKFSDGSRYTVKYDGMLVVREKINEVMDGE